MERDAFCRIDCQSWNKIGEASSLHLYKFKLLEFQLQTRSKFQASIELSLKDFADANIALAATESICPNAPRPIRFRPFPSIIYET